MVLLVIWGFPKIRYLFGGPNNKDCNIWGSTIGFPLFWEITIYASKLFRMYLVYRAEGVRNEGESMRKKIKMPCRPRSYSDS